MCGIVGINARNPINQELFDSLIALQHRGQNAAGMVTCDQDKFRLHKGNGLVRDVFRTRHIRELTGHAGIGHVRYGTAGSGAAEEAQPFYVNSPYGIALAHNGNLTNTEALSKELFQVDLRHLNTRSDSEVLLNVFAHELQTQHQVQVQPEHIFKAVSGVHERCRGAYAVVALIMGFGLVGFRDPYGIRPLVYGVRQTEEGPEYMLASETVALDALGFKMLGDVAPGEAIYITQQGEIYRHQCTKNPKLHPCLFEYVYLARPDTFIEGVSVYKVRLKLGEYLADKILQEFPDHDIDVVMPIPDTSRTAASSLATRLGLKFREGFVKNRYIGRTFIMAGQKQRRRSVRQKLNPIPLEFRDKSVLLVDDSIVRGTTSKEIVQMARDAGARKVYFASTAPAVAYSNVYGIDIPSLKELVAHRRNTEEIAQLIGADRLFYQNLDRLVAACQEGNPGIARFEDSVFSGNYVTNDISPEYLERLAAGRCG